MQLYAYDKEEQLISAQQAHKHTDYFCLECKSIVRLRSGPHRQRHFYHTAPTPQCRQHQKGATHIYLQHYLQQKLTLSDARLEWPFPQIGRIADVAWLSKKIVFEIQYSHINAQELLARNSDYARLGWQVIWIFHDFRYNQRRLTAAEMAVRNSPHYFSNMEPQKGGIIYDQFDLCENGIRKHKLPQLELQFDNLNPRYLPKNILWPLISNKERLQSWSLSLKGDMASLVMDNTQTEYLQQAKALEMAHLRSISSQNRSIFAKLFQDAHKIYQTIFRYILEKHCR